MQRVLLVMTFLGLALVLGAGAATAAPVSWVDWTAAVVGTAGSALGSLPGGILVTYAGEVYFETQTAGGTNYWVPSTPYVSATVDNAPPCCDVIALVGGTGKPPSVLTFSTPLVNPVMAILSLGQIGFPVDYAFGQPFDVLSVGRGFFGGGTLTELPGNVLRGAEGHGTIQFLGTFSSISWTTAPGEAWHGFTIGILQDEVAVPEPTTLTLFALGLVVSFGARRFGRRAA